MRAVELSGIQSGPVDGTVTTFRGELTSFGVVVDGGSRKSGRWRVQMI